MSDRKPLVLGTDTTTGAVIQQQVQTGDQVDPATLPDDRETKTRRLLRRLISYLVDQGFEDLPEDLMAEIEDIEEFDENES